MSAPQPGDPTTRRRQQGVGDTLRQDTRNRLVKAAAQEFPAHGYAGTTVTRLAAGADPEIAAGWSELQLRATTAAGHSTSV